MITINSVPLSPFVSHTVKELKRSIAIKETPRILEDFQQKKDGKERFVLKIQTRSH